MAQHLSAMLPLVCSVDSLHYSMPAFPAEPVPNVGFAAGSVIRNQQYPDAVNLLLRFAAACDASSAKSSQCRAYLGAIVVQLFAENALEAWQIYQVTTVVLFGNHWPAV